jgi:hydrogenase nickel incorporation protein HypA/HybF
MHELTVATNIIGIVASEAKVRGAGKVTEVCLEIGLLAGIEYDSLEFALSALMPGTVMADAAITVEKPEGRARCRKCGHEFPFSNFTGTCGRCGSGELDIIGGNEMTIKHIVI